MVLGGDRIELISQLFLSLLLCIATVIHQKSEHNIVEASKIMPDSPPTVHYKKPMDHAPPPPPPPPTIYHEKQTRQMCALHALNNLFQSRTAFSKASLDQIAISLAPDSILFNPHRSFFGLGNYDVNVVQMALQQKQYEACWFNKRKDPASLNLDKIYGFILNIENQCDLWQSLATLFATSKRHWIAVRQIQGTYYNLDSKLKQPVVIGDNNDLVQYLRDQLISPKFNAEVFVIVTKEVAQDGSWWLAVNATVVDSNNKGESTSSLPQSGSKETNI